MVIRWEKSALNDLQEFKEISKIVNIKQYIVELVQYVDNLKEYTNLGKIYSYINGYIIRQLIYKKHKIFYIVDVDKIRVISIVHHKQNIDNKIRFIKEKLKDKVSD